MSRWRWLFYLAVLVQLVVLYSPSSGTGATPYQLDKAVHAAIFAAVAVTGVIYHRRAARPWPLWLLAGALMLHAPLSEVLQAALLPARSGDPWDAVADLAGAVLGLYLAFYRKCDEKIRTSADIL